MLVLTRRPGQGIHIGSGVRVVVVEVSGDHVRLGIEAPEQESILRDEVLERVARANDEAARHARPTRPLRAASRRRRGRIE